MVASDGEEYKINDQEKLDFALNEEKITPTEKDSEENSLFKLNEGKKALVYKRYYHVFKNGELEELIQEIPELEIEESFYDHANWCVKLKKK